MAGVGDHRGLQLPILYLSPLSPPQLSQIHKVAKIHAILEGLLLSNKESITDRTDEQRPVREAVQQNAAI